MYNRMFLVLAVLVCLAGTAFGQADPGERDTVTVANVVTDEGQKVVVDVTFYNDEELGALTIPLSWSSPDITLDSVSYVGSRVSYVNNKPITIDNENQTVIFGCIVFFEAYIQPGTGLAGKLYFDVPPGTPGQFVFIDSTTVTPATLVLNKADGSGFVPEFNQGVMTVGTPPNPPHISLSPTSMEFTGTIGFGDPSDQVLHIDNSGGEDLFWNATQSSSWLSLSPTSGQAPSVSQVSVSMSGLPVGTYFDTIVVSSGDADNSPQIVPVTFNIVQLPPNIVYEPASFFVSAIQDGVNPEDDTLDIWTTVTGSELNWTVTNNSTWLSISPTSGTPPDQAILSFDITGLTFGVYSDTIVISDPEATNSPQRVPVTLQIVSDLPVLLLDPDTLHVIAPAGQVNTTGVFTILNDGEGTMTFSCSETSSRIIGISPSTGSAPQDVTVSFKTFSLDPGDYYDTLVVTSTEAINSPQYLVTHLHIALSPANLLVLPDTVHMIYFECWQGVDSIPDIETFQVLNTGGEIMRWTLEHSEDWLVPSQLAGINDELVSLSLDAGGFPLGTYYDKIYIHAINAINQVDSILVVLDVIEGPTPDLVATPSLTRVAAQEIFGPTFNYAVSTKIVNYNPGCMDWYIEEDIPWLNFIDESGTAPSWPRVVVDVGSYTYGTYVDSFYIYAPGALNSPVTQVIAMDVWRYHGDANWDLVVNLGDCVHMINYLFKNGPDIVPEYLVGDCNCNKTVDLGDCVHIVNYLFKGGDAPCGNP